MNDRTYLGKTESGKWEEFGWNLDNEPTPQETGYVEVKAR